MTGVPPPTLYHRWLGWHAPAMRRAVTVLIAGLIVTVVLLPFVTWGLALAGGWNAAALAFLSIVWPIIIQADSSPRAKTRQRARPGCCWSGPAWPASWGRVTPFTSPGSTAARRGCC